MVFISYAREDKRLAERLYMDLRKSEINVWLDTKCLLPGQDWKFEIKKAIRNSSFFIALISEYSLNKRGFVQRELREGLEILKEFPKNKIFLIPVLLDSSSPEDEELRDLNWLYLTDSYRKGVKRILSIISDLPDEPNSNLKESIDYRDPIKGLGVRAPIDFVPFASFPEFSKEFLKMFPESTSFLDTEHSIYLTYFTNKENVVIPEYLKKEYPTEMTIVLQNQFKDLVLFPNFFEVTLYFNRKEEVLKISYSSIKEIFSPTMDIRISRLRNNT